MNDQEERHAKLKEIPIWEDVTLDDYWIAPSGLGPLAYEWSDKPHRLLYQLINHIEDMETMLDVAREG